MHLIWLKKIFSISKNFPVHHTGKWLVYIYKPSWTLFSCAYTRYTRPTQYPSSLPRIGWPNKPATHIYNWISLLHSNTYIYIYIYIHTHNQQGAVLFLLCAKSKTKLAFSKRKRKRKKVGLCFHVLIFVIHGQLNVLVVYLEFGIYIYMYILF